jgi:hypothetical protein
LFFVVDAPINDTDLQAGVLSEHAGVIEDLHRELARRREDERADSRLAASRHGVRQQALEQRDQECGGLARAGLCLSRDVLAGERDGQRARLDGGCADESCVADAARDFRNEIERREGQLGKVCLCH